MTNNPPLVSIIIPIYNAQTHLHQCLGSLLEQTYDNIEIICIDDGSTDDSPSLLLQHQKKDSRIKVIRQNNSGPGVARNVGIDNAQGEYLYFFDSDDFCKASLIERAVQELTETGADLAVFPFLEYSQRCSISKRPNWSLRGDKFSEKTFTWRDNPDWIFEEFQNFPWNKVFKASFIRNNSLRYQEIYLTEDLMFSACSLVLAESIVWVDEPLVYHRIDTGTNVMANKDLHPFDFIDAFKCFKLFLEKHNLYSELQAAYANWTVDACIYNLHTLNSLECFTEVYEALAAKEAHALGLYEIDSSLYRRDQCREFLSSLCQDSSRDYLYAQYRLAREDRDRFLYVLQAQQNELLDLKRDKEQIESELQALQDTHKRIMNAAEQKVGRAICHIPRAIQRAWLNRKTNQNARNNATNSDR